MNPLGIVFSIFSILSINSFQKVVNKYGFQGSGTQKDPYLISTKEDFFHLASLVNDEAYEFKDSYFRQTNNIDLENDLWIPIGIYGSDKYFYGFFDGDGHYVENLNINREDNCGFFGKLGGTCINFGIESGIIDGNGNCNGAISSHAASSDALIFNCYNKAEVHGYRAGGIVDNFSGSVINCWTDCKLVGEEIGGITSYDTSYLFHCISTNKISNHELDPNSNSYETTIIETEKNTSFLNEGTYLRNNVGLKYDNFNGWKLENGNLVFSQNKQAKNLIKDLLLNHVSDLIFGILGVMLVLIGGAILVMFIVISLRKLLSNRRKEANA